MSRFTGLSATSGGEERVPRRPQHAGVALSHPEHAIGRHGHAGAARVEEEGLPRRRARRVAEQDRDVEQGVERAPVVEQPEVRRRRERHRRDARPLEHVDEERQRHRPGPPAAQEPDLPLHAGEPPRVDRLGGALERRGERREAQRGDGELERHLALPHDGAGEGGRLRQERARRELEDLRVGEVDDAVERVDAQRRPRGALGEQRERRGARGQAEHGGEERRGQRLATRHHLPSPLGHLDDLAQLRHPHGEAHAAGGEEERLARGERGHGAMISCRAMTQSVLLVDDERFARTVYSDYLRAAGWEVEVADGAESALAVLAHRRFDVLLTDVILPGAKDGLELLDQAKQLDPHVGVIVITALDKVDPAVRAMRSGASDYLVKPVTPEALQLAVQRCLSTRALLAENQALRGHLKLFETGQRIVSTLDRGRLVPMALAAIASECGSTACVLAERTTDGKFVAAGAHGLEPGEAADLLGASRAALDALDAYGPAFGAVPLAAPLRGATHAACLTVTEEGTLVGAVVVLRDAPLSHAIAENAAFLCRHLGIALRNLGRLSQVEHLAYLDDLTHLYNVRYLEVALGREIAGGRPFSVLFMDLDHFKNVNDVHGHLSGSRLLVEVARVLRSCVRDEDVVVRYGGDEYVVLLVGIDSGGGLKVAERIRRAIEDHRFLSREGARVRITASIGLASFPEHAAAQAEILDLADRAMYRGKRTTRNVVYMASKDLPPVPPGDRA